MKNTKKRFLSRVALLLSVAMLAGVTVALPISADDSNPYASSDPDGTYAIDSLEDLQKLSGVKDTEHTYYLTKDIDATEATGDTIIGVFSGDIDGCGYSIKLNRPLITRLNGGSIKNLNLISDDSDTAITAVIKNSNTNSTACSAALVLLVGEPSIFENIINNVDVKVTSDSNAAGLVAAIRGSIDKTVFKNCINTGDITNKGGKCGGLGGLMNSAVEFENCKNDGCLNTNNQHCGGIVSYAKADATITNCVNNGAVNNSEAHSAGIICYANTDATIKNCVNNGAITQDKCGSYYTGGIVAVINQIPTISKCTNTGNIKACYVGGIAGYLNSNATGKRLIEYCVNKGEINTVDMTSKKYTAGIVAFMAAGTDNEIIGCVNTANVNGDDTGYNAVSAICGYCDANVLFKNNISTGQLIGGSSRYALNYIETTTNSFKDGTGNNFVLKDSVPYTCYKDGALQDDWDTTSVVTEVTSEQLASGEVAFLLQEAGANFGQLIGTDVLPVIGSTDKVIQKLSGETKYYVNQNNVLKGTAGVAEGYIQFAAENSGYQGVRVLFVVEETGIAEIADMKIKITFNLAEGGTKSRTESIGSYFSSVIADGAPWAAEDGYVIVGVGVTGVPDNAWTSFTFELISGDGTNAAYNATASYTQPVA